MTAGELAGFWGKARPDLLGESKAHPLVAHSLDVAAVAVLLSQPRKPVVDPRMLGFLVSLHDLGKFSRPFQAKAATHWPTSVLGNFGYDVPPGPGHDTVGASVLSHSLAARLSDILPPTAGDVRGWKQGDRLHLWRALAGHHGRPPRIEDSLPSSVFCPACQTAAGEFIDTMRAIFQPPVWTRPPEQQVIRFSWQLAGLTTLADWVGSSRQAWFPYVTEADVADPARYFWGFALPRAAAALASAGLATASPAMFTGLRGLFPGVALLTPLQQWAESIALPAGPVLAVIEDLTGSGKTEAALTLAHRLLADRRAGGVYLALPTMATANAMFRRLAAAYVDCLYRTVIRPLRWHMAALR
jgi:CRISPR-associated endonuclease/helicase Cas3